MKIKTVLFHEISVFLQTMDDLQRVLRWIQFNKLHAKKIVKRLHKTHQLEISESL